MIALSSLPLWLHMVQECPLLTTAKLDFGIYRAR
jgi:hypothetical protein